MVRHGGSTSARVCGGAVVIEKITPRDRSAWLRARGQDVTASIVGALFDCHEFVTPYQLWASKTGRLPRQDQETPAMRRGRLLESVAVQIIRENHPTWSVDHNAADNVYFRDPDARLGATPDVIVDAPGLGRGVVQIKSVEASIYRRKWFEGGGDDPEPPLWIALQAILEAHLTGADWAAVAPLVVGHGVECPLIVVDMTHAEAVIEQMRARAAEFWQMVAEDREPVPDYERDAGLIDDLYAYGDAREEVDLSTDNRIPILIAEREQAWADKRAAAARIAAAEAEIKAKMGRAEVAHIGRGRRITWNTHRRAAYAAPASTYRTLRFPKTGD